MLPAKEHGLVAIVVVTTIQMAMAAKRGNQQCRIEPLGKIDGRHWMQQRCENQDFGLLEKKRKADEDRIMGQRPAIVEGQFDDALEPSSLKPSLNPCHVTIPTQDQYESAIRSGVSFPQKVYGIFCDADEPTGYDSSMNGTSPQQSATAVAVLPKTTTAVKGPAKARIKRPILDFQPRTSNDVSTNQSPIESEKESAITSADDTQGPLNAIGVAQASNQGTESQNSRDQNNMNAQIHAHPACIQGPQLSLPLPVIIALGMPDERSKFSKLADYLLLQLKAPFAQDKVHGIKDENINSADVLCGRGDFCNKHQGNIFFRKLVSLFYAEYKSAPKGTKQYVSRKVVVLIRFYQGRFLKRNADKDLWFEVGDVAATTKAEKAFRELNTKTSRNGDTKPKAAKKQKKAAKKSK